MHPHRNLYLLMALSASLLRAATASRIDLAKDWTIQSSAKVTEKGKVGTIAISKKVHLGANETARVSFSPEEFAQLNVGHPKLWWPYPLGPQNLHELKLDFVTGGGVSDHQDIQFGIREITSEVDAQTHRLFKINGKNILIRGGGWSSDMMLRVNDEREE